MTPPPEQDDLDGTTLRPRSALPLAPREPLPDERCHALVLLSGEPRGQIFPFDKSPFVIGRTGPADLLLPGTDVSRRHCQVNAVAGQAFVMDLNSSNGTFLNGMRLEANTPAALFDGAMLEVGSHKFRYEKRSRTDAGTTETPAGA